MKLSDKQQAFVNEYLIDLNATQAAIRAGYSEKTAKSQGQRLLTNVDVQKALQEAKNKRTERTLVNADYVLNRLVEIDQMDVADILNDQGFVKPVADWPKCWRQTISGLDITELFEYQDGSKDLTGLVKKIKWPDKLKNIELLGKHVDVQAFKEHVTTETTITVKETLAEKLKRGSKR